MAQGILDIFRQSNDANLGQTLVRLAKLAEARHRYESTFEQVSSRKDESPTQGGGRTSVARHASMETLAQTFSQTLSHDASAHTEVDR